MILLDTHAWFWFAADPKRLSGPAARAIGEATSSGGLSIASISLWEVAWMMARGRIHPRGTPESTLAHLVDRTGVIVKEITPTIAALAAQLGPDFPSDPADRLIAATARAEAVPLVTRDRAVRASNAVTTIW
ncbi:MAG: type II toxin-antitoxin system VapC family toxin [Candidatus Rokubacteria bacterium]|nr:type II toxin-antitoxin system VapC family toxin [Candidatus Rokubacteria bacterium]